MYHWLLHESNRSWWTRWLQSMSSAHDLQSPSEDAGKSLVQVDAIYESFLINHCQGHIHTPPNGQWQSVLVKGEWWLQFLAVPLHSLILLGFRSIKPIAASYCSHTVSSVSCLDWSNDLMEASVCLCVCLSISQLDLPWLLCLHLRDIFFGSFSLFLIAVSFFFQYPPSPMYLFRLLTMSPSLCLSPSLSGTSVKHPL